MRQIHDQQYAEFTSRERLNLTVAALARGDMAEADRLWQTSPRYHYMTHDLEYTEGVGSLIMLSSLFFEQCVYHYNLIKKAQMFIMGLEQDLDDEKKEGLTDLVTQTRKLLDVASKAQDVHVSKIKALFEGFKKFCIEVGLDSEAVLKTISINDCCNDIDFFLSSDIKIDETYINATKQFFLERWIL